MINDLILHELKSPITVIRGFAEILRDQDLGFEERQKIAEKMVKSCNRLEKLIASFGHVKPEKIDLVPIVKEFSDVQLKYPDQAWILGDPVLIDVAIRNLVENARKHSKGLIWLSLDKKGREIEVKVKDQGVGISKEALPHIFERFYRGDRTKAGMGLGLAIVKSIVEKHKGSVSVESELGKGSTFTLSFPQA